MLLVKNFIKRLLTNINDCFSWNIFQHRVYSCSHQSDTCDHYVEVKYQLPCNQICGQNRWKTLSRGQQQCARKRTHEL